MKKIYLLVFTLFSAVTVNAASYKNLLDEPPESNSPVGVYIKYLKAAAKEDLEAMRSLSTGLVRRHLEKEELAQKDMERAKDVDWSKPIMWAHRIDGDSAKIGIRYKRISDGRTFNVKRACQLVDGVWKFGEPVGPAK